MSTTWRMKVNASTSLTHKTSHTTPVSVCLSLSFAAFQTSHIHSLSINRNVMFIVITFACISTTNDLFFCLLDCFCWVDMRSRIAFMSMPFLSISLFSSYTAQKIVRQGEWNPLLQRGFFKASSISDQIFLKQFFNCGLSRHGIECKPGNQYPIHRIEWKLLALKLFETIFMLWLSLWSTSWDCYAGRPPSVIFRLV